MSTHVSVSTRMCVYVCTYARMCAYGLVGVLSVCAEMLSLTASFFMLL